MYTSFEFLTHVFKFFYHLIKIINFRIFFKEKYMTNVIIKKNYNLKDILLISEHQPVFEFSLFSVQRLLSDFRINFLTYITPGLRSVPHLSILITTFMFLLYILSS